MPLCAVPLTVFGAGLPIWLRNRASTLSEERQSLLAPLARKLGECHAITIDIVPTHYRTIHRSAKYLQYFISRDIGDYPYKIIWYRTEIIRKQEQLSARLFRSKFTDYSGLITYMRVLIHQITLTQPSMDMPHLCRKIPHTRKDISQTVHVQQRSLNRRSHQQHQCPA